MRREALEASIPACKHPDWAQWERGLEDLASEFGGLRDMRATAAGLARDNGDARADERTAELRGRRGADLAEQRQIRAKREARERGRETARILSQGRGMGF